MLALWVMAAVAAEPSIDFLAGCWVTKPGAPTTTESWVGPVQGVMTGSLVADHQGSATWEHFLMAPTGGVLTLTVTPKGQATVDFALSEHGPGRLVFSNPTHDFPQRIVYEKTAEGLMVRAEAKSAEGAWQGLGLDYRRCSEL